jgi:hypothetical protein
MDVDTMLTIVFVVLSSLFLGSIVLIGYGDLIFKKDSRDKEYKGTR